MITTLRGHPTPFFHRDGTKAGLGQWTGLDFLWRNLRMSFPTLETKKMLPQRMGIMSRCVCRHVRPLSMRMLVDIERFSTSVNCPPVLRNVGDGILFMTYTYFRWKQTAPIQLYFIVDGCLCGQVDTFGGSRLPLFSYSSSLMVVVVCVARLMLIRVRLKRQDHSFFR
jgi:hypothetical protein